MDLPEEHKELILIGHPEDKDSVDLAESEDSSRKSEEIEVEIEQPKDEYSSEKAEDLEVKVKKLEDKLRLIALELDKKSTDLEIKIGKADERFKEVAYDFPKFKEKSEEIENLLGVMNLGLADFKERFTDIDSRMAKLEKMPEGLERGMVILDNKLKKLDEDVKKLYLRLDEIGTIKQDVTKTLEDKISLSSENIRKEITDNKAEIEHVKKNLDALSFAIKSFERTVELTNLDDIIKRFDVIDRKILTMQTELEKLRSPDRDASAVGEDVETLKKRFKQMILTVMDALNRINKFEVEMNSKLARVEALERAAMSLETVKAMADTSIEQVKKMNELKSSMEDLYGKIKRIYDSGNIGWDRLQNIVHELSELDKLKVDLEDVRRAVIENRSKIKDLKR